MTDSSSSRFSQLLRVYVAAVSNESLTSARSRPSSRRSARRPKKTQLKRTASSLDISVRVTLSLFFYSLTVADCCLLTIASGS